MHGVEKKDSRARTRKARKMHFCTPRRVSRMHTTNWNLMMLMDSRVIQMIIAHQSFHIINIYLRPKVTLHCLFIYPFRIFMSDI